MNTTTTTNTSAAGLPRGVWIGGGLMAVTIVALATTLVVRSNSDSAPDTATQAAVTAPGDASTATTPVVAQQSITPVNESTRPAHHATSSHTDSHGGATASGDAPQQVAAVPACATCGVIDGYSAVQVQGKNNGVGAVAGGVGGALIGSKIAGRNNHTLGGAIGAIGGGLLGNAIESHERTTTAYDVRVRMNDGTIRTVRQSHVPTVGQRVNVEGNTIHVVDAQG